VTRVTAAVAAFPLSTPALAQPLPYPKQPGKQCSGSYRESGGFCVPKSDRSPPAIPKGSGQCPSGWRQSGSACEKMR
jgi:hypothetical protein